MGWFKKHFIPHKGNEFKPHFLRKEIMALVLVLVIAVEFTFLIQVFVVFKTTDFLASVLPGALISMTNDARSQIGAKILSESSLLDKAAELKASDMASRGYFSHVSPEGITPWYWFEKVGYSYGYAGENLAVNFTDSEDVVRAWLKSPSHRANIINPEYSNIGIGTAKGIYEGRDAVFVVEFFGTPANGVEQAVTRNEEPKEITSAGAQVHGPQSKVLGQSVVSTVKPSTSFIDFLRRVSTSPRSVSALAYGFIFLVILSAVTLAFFIEIRVQHPRLLGSGLAILTLLALFSFYNNGLTWNSPDLPDSNYAASVIQAF